jgi:hypothetical protein
MLTIKYYLKYLQEREWDEDPGNDDAFDQKVYSKVLGGDKSSIDPFNDVRHDLDTNYFDIYMKNVLGDYKGRVDSYNVTSDKMPFGKDVDKKINKIKADYKKLTKNDEEIGQKAKMKAKMRNPDDDFELRDDNANIWPGGEVGDGTDGGDGGGEGNGGGE